jgi:hypothetical protein
VSLDYSEAEWAEAAGHRPLKAMDVNEIVALNRHYIWALQQRDRMSAAIPQSKSPAEEGETFYLSDVFSAWFLWAGLLWAVIESFQERGVEFRGQLAADVEYVSAALRRCRNAIFHVPKRPHDPRYFALMRLPDSTETMHRLSWGIGRLFIEEQQARGLRTDAPRPTEPEVP